MYNYIKVKKKLDTYQKYLILLFFLFYKLETVKKQKFPGKTLLTESLYVFEYTRTINFPVRTNIFYLIMSFIK